MPDIMLPDGAPAAAHREAGCGLSAGVQMFLTILHMRYLKAMAEYALLLLLVGVGIFTWATWGTGVTLYLVPALVLPIAECGVRFRWIASFTEKQGYIVGLSVAFAHAVFLGLAQSGAVEGAWLAVICQYLSLVVVGTGLGCMLVTNQILAHKEPKKSKTVGKGKGGYQRPRKSTVKKPKK
jgi:hypothetical protein